MLFLCLFPQLLLVAGHGRMTNPPARQLGCQKTGACGSVNGLVGGGPGTVHRDGDYIHGICGNSPTEPQTWAVPGPITTTYTEGQMATFEVVLTTHHIGFFEFELCDSPDITETCFKQHRLRRTNCTGTDVECRKWWKPLVETATGKWMSSSYPDSAPKLRADNSHVTPWKFRMNYDLPRDLSCTHCVVRWHYITTNSCSEHSSAPEEFWNCGDVRIEARAGPTTNTDVDPTALNLLTRMPVDLRATQDSTDFWSCPAGPLPASNTGSADDYSCDLGSVVRGACLWCNLDYSCPNEDTFPPTVSAQPTPAPSPFPTQDAATPTALPTSSPTRTSPTSPPTDGEGCVGEVGAWAKCAGIGFTTRCCKAGTTCMKNSEWYSQCRTGACPAGWECGGNNSQPTPQPTTLTPEPTTLITPTPEPTAKTTSEPTSQPTPSAGPTSECVTHAQLKGINGESTFWPRCDPSQAEKGTILDGREYGLYCTQQWTDELNLMLTELGYCNQPDIIRKFLAQVAWETGYYSTLYQPADGGAGMIHMIPQNWGINVEDMEEVFPGQGIQAAYDAIPSANKKSFFQSPQFGWKSAAAWFKRTNRVIGGCDKDLFVQSYNEQTRCILSRINNRDESFNLVSKHI